MTIRIIIGCLLVEQQYKNFEDFQQQSLECKTCGFLKAATSFYFTFPKIFKTISKCDKLPSSKDVMFKTFNK